MHSTPSFAMFSLLLLDYGLAMGDPLSRDLLHRALNWHGQQLTSFIQQAGGDSFARASEAARGLDYHLYHSRGRELGAEGRGQRLLLHRFVAQNLDGLFAERHTAEAEETASGGGGSARMEDTMTTPPLETFLENSVDPDKRTQHFFELVQPGDVLICRVGAMNKAGLLLNVLCFGGTTRKSRLVHDLRLRCFCPAEETVPPTEPPGRRSYDKDDVVATVVLEVRRDSQRLLVSMKAENLRDESQRDTVRLGSAGRLGVGVPGRYLLTKEAERDDLSYSECLERSAEHINPSCVENMARDLGLPFAGGACSLFDTLRCGFPESEKAPTLRKQQNAKWAFGHVASGIRYFKAGNNVEAFQCLNQALKIDPANVEGLVARGALYANNGSLEKAVSDFEEALGHNATHRNSRKYLCETLAAIARAQEAEGKNEEAAASYMRILEVDPEHREAQESVRYLEKKLAQDPREEMKDKIDLLIKSSEKKRSRKKKKRRSRSSSSSSGSSSSRSSSSESDSDSSRSRRRRKSKSKKRKNKRKSSSKDRGSSRRKSVEDVVEIDRSPSPFSKRMMPAEANSEAPEGFNPAVNNPLPPPQATTAPEEDLSIPTAITTGAPPTTFPGAFCAPPPSYQGMLHAAHHYGGFNVPPPGYPPAPGYYGAPPAAAAAADAATAGSSKDDAYLKAVEAFLEKTNQGKSDKESGDSKWRRHSRSRSKSRERSKSKRKDSPPKKRSAKDDSDSDDSSRKKKKKKKDKERDREEDKKQRLKERSMEELVKMGFQENMDVDKFAEKITRFISKSEQPTATSTSTGQLQQQGPTKEEEDEDRVPGGKKVFVEGLDFVVKDLKKGDAAGRVREVKAELGKRDKSPPLPRILSPSVTKVFNVSEEEEDEEEKEEEKRKKEEEERRRNKRESSKNRSSKNTEEFRPMWKPQGRDSFLTKLDQARARLKSRERGEEEVERWRRGRENRRHYQEERRSREDRRSSSSSSSRHPQKTEFIVKLDSVTGMFTRVPKPGGGGGGAEDNGGGEKRIIRKVDSSPPRSPGRMRRRSRSRSPGSRRRSRSRSRERRRQLPHPPHHYHDRRRRSRSRSGSPPRGRQQDYELEGMRKETAELLRERERIEQEKQELLSQAQLGSLPKPVPVTARLGPKLDNQQPSSSSTSEGKWDDALDSVLKAVGPSSSSKAPPPAAKADSILPGASSFEDLEAMLDAEKRKKKDEMRERNRGFAQKPKQQW